MLLVTAVNPAKELNHDLQPQHRTRKAIAALMAAGLLGRTAAGAIVVAQNAPAQTPGAMRAVAAKSTVPTPLTRAETAAEDVIGFLENGKPAKSKAEARILRDLAHGGTADALRRAGVSDASIKAFQARADRTARLSLTGAPAVQVGLAANSVSRLMPGFYARYHDPVPATVLKLDYLDREIQLRSQAGQPAKVRQAVAELASTWRQLRPRLVAAGGVQVARSYDQHARALKSSVTATAVQKQALHGLDVVDQMETVFLK